MNTAIENELTRKQLFDAVIRAANKAGYEVLAGGHWIAVTVRIPCNTPIGHDAITFHVDYENKLVVSVPKKRAVGSNFQRGKRLRSSMLTKYPAPRAKKINAFLDSIV